MADNTKNPSRNPYADTVDPSFNPYERLGVAKDAQEADIRNAYRKGIAPVHQDRDAGLDETSRATNAMRREELLKAQNILLNQRHRAAYDQQIGIPSRAPFASTPSAPLALSSGDTASQNAAREAGYLQSLAAARVKGAILKRIAPAAKAELTEPSSTRFGLAVMWAAIGDSFVELIKTIAIAIATFLGIGVGGFMVWVITSILEFIIFEAPVVLMCGGSVKNNSLILERAHEEIEMHHRRLVSYRLRYAYTLKAGRSISSMRKPVNKIALRFMNIRDVARKSVWGRFWKRIGAEKIPLIDLWPFNTLGVLKEKKRAWEIYELAKEAVAEAKQAREDADSAENDLQLAA